MASTFQRDSKDVPTDKVLAMRKQGLTDNQIIQSLQHEGFDSQNILEALEMADMNKTTPAQPGAIPQTPMGVAPKSIAPPGNLTPGGPAPGAVPAGNMPPPGGLPRGMPPPPGAAPMGNMPPPGMSAPGVAPISDEESSSGSNEDVEELIEAIIDEKWAEVEKDINRVLEWKDSVDEKLGAMEEDIKELTKNFDDLHKAILGKIGDYDKNILNVGTQLKAMEQVFSKVLPTFTDNVSELNRIADRLNSSSKRN